MTPRPIYKWKTLWLGLLILASLTWAWSRSRSHIDYASASLGPSTWCGILSADGYLGCRIATYPHGTVVSTARFDYGSITDSAKPWFPKPFHNAQDQGLRAHSYGIAHWLITLLFLLTWSTLLLWRWKKSKRPASLPIPPAPAP